MIKGANVQIKTFFKAYFSKKNKRIDFALSHSNKRRTNKKKNISIAFGKYTQPYYICTKINILWQIFAI